MQSLYKTSKILFTSQFKKRNLPSAVQSERDENYSYMSANVCLGGGTSKIVTPEETNL